MHTCVYIYTHCCSCLAGRPRVADRPIVINQIIVSIFQVEYIGTLLCYAILDYTVIE